MSNIGYEHYCIGEEESELEARKDNYCVENGITKEWMKTRVKCILEDYYCGDSVRCTDRFRGDEEYKIWKSETGMLKRLLARLDKTEDGFIVIWE